MLCSGLPVHAQPKGFTLEDVKAGRVPLKMVSPIFGQIVMFSMPGNFIIVQETAKGGFYIREAVPRGETGARWTQMITVTGSKGLAKAENFTPQKAAAAIASGFKPACPATFSAKPVGALSIGGHDAYAALASCGTTQNGGYAHSESALLIFIKGAEDVYSIQWAERGSTSDGPIDLNDAKWQDRVKVLNPIKVCDRVAGEAAPFPSCIGQK